MTITVRNGKGSKDRLTILSKKLLTILRIYYRKYSIRPTGYLFPGKDDQYAPFSKRQTQHFIHEAGLKARIKKMFPLIF